MTSRAVLFDLDGTLVDSTKSVARCWNRLAIDAKLDVSKLHGLHGIPAKVFIRTLLGENRSDEVDYWSDWHLENESTDVADVTAIDGVQELLKWIDDSDWSWGIVTSCQQRLAVARLTAAGLPIPEIFVTADDVRIGKPDPEPYLLGAHRFGIDASHTVVIEDAPAGIRSGKAAGATVIGVVTTHPVEELHEADVIALSMAEIQQFLANR